MAEKNEVALFEAKYLQQFKKLSVLKIEQDRLAQIEKSVKEELQAAMQEYGIKSIKNEYLTISTVEGSTTTTIDLAKFQEKEPTLYAEILEDYPKITTKKPSIRFTVK